MPPLELRAPTDDDRDGLLAALRHPDATAVGPVPGAPLDAAALEAWLSARRRAAGEQVFAVVRDGRVVGAAALLLVEGEAELGCRVADTDGETGFAVVEQLLALEPVRPLYARVGPADAAGVAALERAGFTPLPRKGAAGDPGSAETVYAVMPVIDGY